MVCWHKLSISNLKSCQSEKPGLWTFGFRPFRGGSSMCLLIRVQLSLLLDPSSSLLEGEHGSAKSQLQSTGVKSPRQEITLSEKI